MAGDSDCKFDMPSKFKLLAMGHDEFSMIVQDYTDHKELAQLFYGKQLLSIMTKIESENFASTFHRLSPIVIYSSDLIFLDIVLYCFYI